MKADFEEQQNEWETQRETLMLQLREQAYAAE
jgi:hypothetical protein